MVDTGMDGIRNLDGFNLKRPIYSFFRRFQDIFFSLLAIIVLSPLLIITALAVVIDDPKGGPIFSQIRVGKNGKLLVGIQRRFLATESAISGFFYENARAL